MKISTLFFVLATLFLTQNAYAANWCAGCKIKSIAVGPHYDKNCNGASCALVRIDSGKLDRAACSTGGNWHYVVDMSTTTGQMVYSHLLTAYTAGLSLDMIGLDTCSLMSGTEDLGAVYFPW